MSAMSMSVTVTARLSWWARLTIFLCTKTVAACFFLIEFAVQHGVTTTTKESK